LNSAEKWENARNFAFSWDFGTSKPLGSGSSSPVHRKIKDVVAIQFLKEEIIPEPQATFICELGILAGNENPALVSSVTQQFDPFPRFARSGL
jgi:hypothetical protein